jgi:phosphoribosylglycinamide formyltransferase-1
MPFRLNFNLHSGRPTMPERFIGEPIKPSTETADTSRMAIGEPGLPSEFVWRGRTVSVRKLLRSWRQTGKCRHGSPEMYVRKHWYEVATASDGTMKLYFERQPRRGKRIEPRWWLFSIRDPEESPSPNSYTQRHN